jgi:CheY-like chemotaxis protein
VQQDELLETIYRVMSRAPGDTPMPVEEPARKPSPVPALAPLRILLAEDDEFSAQLMEKLLGRQRHRVRLVSNGREALALAWQGAFDLMILDVHMPELDGIEVVRGIRERERVSSGHLPVIALTARSRKEDRERCLAAGVDDYLTKPVSPADLLAAIDRLVPAYGASRSAQMTPGERIGLVDPVAVLTACGGDAEAFDAICATFEAYLPVRVTEMSDALRVQDAPRLREAAHKLSGLLAAFSTTAADVALDLEEHAAQGQLPEARQLVERLEALVRELLPLVGRMSLETLRRHVEIGDNPKPRG